jgi:DNA invertase Pin-like site-specific DNA recombinase
VIRQSRSGEDAVSPAQQKHSITSYAAAHGHAIVGWATDLDVSGAMPPFDRPELGKWLTPDRMDEYDGLIAWKIDRLSRRLLHFAALIDWADRNHKSLAAVADPLDTTTHMGRVIAQIIALLAEWELENIRQRNLATHKTLRGTTRFQGGAVPYGYWPVDNPEGKGKVLAIDPETADVVAGMVAAIMDGKSMASVRDDLAARGVLAPIDYARHCKGQPTQGVVWSTRAVQAILSSRSLLGQFEHKGQVVRDQKTGLPAQRAEPLLTADKWKRLQARLAEAARPRVYRNPKALLADVVVCASCRGKLYHHLPRKGGRSWSYYRCGSRANGKPCARPAGVRVEALDEMVTDAFLGRIGHGERLTRVWRPAEDHSEELATVTRTIDELREEWDLGLYQGDRASYLDRLRWLTDRKTALATLPSRPGGYEFESTGETYAEAWERMETPGRRELLLAAGVVVTVTADKIVMVAVPKDVVSRIKGRRGRPKGWADLPAGDFEVHEARL